MNGIWVPTEKEIEDCLMGNNCNYGICDECIVMVKEKEKESEDEE